MKNKILSLVIFSVCVAGRLNAVVVPPETVDVPEVSMTGLLLGTAILGGLAAKRLWRRR